MNAALGNGESGEDTESDETKIIPESESMTQLDDNDSSVFQSQEPKTENNKLTNKKRDSLSNQWGLLKNEKLSQEYRLFHRYNDLGRDTYVLGRSKDADICVLDSRVSSSHCLIYCIFDQARMRVYVEDQSVNGTYINDSLTRLKRGERAEIRSGFEIFLINPRTNGEIGKFLFINMMERLAAQTAVAKAPTNRLNEQLQEIRTRHIEDYYAIGEQIGSGTCGQVHLCLNLQTREQCAVKVIDTRKFCLSPGLSIRDLREEALMMGHLSHPNIISIKDSFESSHTIYIVMELVRGGDLLDRIVERGRYEEATARTVMQKILNAVLYLHSNEIVHRDLKPENILLGVKITDFGLAKRTNQEGLKTFCGTPQYFAPEVLKRKGTVKGAGRYGKEADMWSLGVVLYILLSGSFPFDEDNLFVQIENAQYSLASSSWSDIGESAKHFVRSLLTLSPKDRLTVQQALLHPWMRGECPVPQERPPSDKPTIQPTMSPSRINSDSSVTVTERSSTSRHLGVEPEGGGGDGEGGRNGHREGTDGRECPTEGRDCLTSTESNLDTHDPLIYKHRWLRNNQSNVVPAAYPLPEIDGKCPLASEIAVPELSTPGPYVDPTGHRGQPRGLYELVVGGRSDPQLVDTPTPVPRPGARKRRSPCSQPRSSKGKAEASDRVSSKGPPGRNASSSAKVSKTGVVVADVRGAARYSFLPLQLTNRRTDDGDELFEEICEWSSDASKPVQETRPGTKKREKKCGQASVPPPPENVRECADQDVSVAAEPLPVFEPFDDVPHKAAGAADAQGEGGCAPSTPTLTVQTRPASGVKSWFEDINLLQPASANKAELSSIPPPTTPSTTAPDGAPVQSCAAVGNQCSGPPTSIPRHRQRDKIAVVRKAKLRVPVRTLTAIFGPGASVTSVVDLVTEDAP